jgi:hypothetical protein
MSGLGGRRDSGPTSWRLANESGNEQGRGRIRARYGRDIDPRGKSYLFIQKRLGNRFTRASRNRWWD